jgi:hypothetical protein
MKKRTRFYIVVSSDEPIWPRLIDQRFKGHEKELRLKWSLSSFVGVLGFWVFPPPPPPPPFRSDEIGHMTKALKVRSLLLAELSKALRIIFRPFNAKEKLRFLWISPVLNCILML